MLSGGMDSALCAAMAMESGYEVAALHLNYGQRTHDRELKAYNDLCDHFQIDKKLIVDVGHLAQIGSSSLTDERIDVAEADLNSKDVPTSYVPFRNGNILAIAASWAEVIGAEAIFAGAMQLDSSGYPDCRTEFFEAFEKAVNLGTKPGTKIRIVTPIIDFTKKDIIENAMKFSIPLELTWSCYQNTEKACGICESCALRLRGFQLAGIEDPLPYIKKPKYI